MSDDWLKTLIEANKETVKWVTILLCVLVGMALGAVLATVLFTDHVITVKIDIDNGTIEVSGGPVQLPVGQIIIEHGKSFIIQDNQKIPLREYFESQGYEVNWDNDKREIVLIKNAK